MTTTLTARAHRAAIATTAVAIGAIGVGCTVTPLPPTVPGTPVVVFDIDGTLTDGELSTTPHPGALDAVEAYRAKGYDVVYVTARWDAVQRSSTESWLADNGFPDEELYMAPSLLLSDESKVDYKTDALTSIEATHAQVVYAYGDSSSDFDAYANVGVAASRVFALQRAGASSCQPGTWAACLPDYVGHLSYIASQPAA